MSRLAQQAIAGRQVAARRLGGYSDSQVRHFSIDGTLDTMDLEVSDASLAQDTPRKITHKMQWWTALKKRLFYDT